MNEATAREVNKVDDRAEKPTKELFKSLDRSVALLYALLGAVTALFGVAIYELVVL